MQIDTKKDILVALDALKKLIEGSSDRKLRMSAWAHLKRIQYNIGDQSYMTDWKCQSCHKETVRCSDGTCLSCWHQNVMGG